MNKTNKVLIVDDVAENRKLLASIIARETDCTVMMAANGSVVLELIENEIPDLILLDIMMPDMDGYEVAQSLKEKKSTKEIPIIFITSMTDMESKIMAFKKGGVDYITKPFNKDELLARVNAQLKLKNLQDELKSKNKMLSDREIHLTHLVEEKTRKIGKVTHALVTALENANLFNDDDTGNHIRRVSEYSALLAEAYGADREFVKRIRLFASLHDVGKVGIPDSILKKPGRYDPEEFEQMKQHVVIGARMLGSGEIDPMAKNIALYHHEKWNGTGYVRGLSGDTIPLEARIVTIADVYDALVTERVYKKAFSREKAEEIIGRERGKHFDPDITDLFFEKSDIMHEIKNSLK